MSITSKLVISTVFLLLSGCTISFQNVLTSHGQSEVEETSDASADIEPDISIPAI